MKRPIVFAVLGLFTAGAVALLHRSTKTPSAPCRKSGPAIQCPRIIFVELGKLVIRPW